MKRIILHVAIMIGLLLALSFVRSDARTKGVWNFGFHYGKGGGLPGHSLLIDASHGLKIDSSNHYLKID